MSDNQIIIPEGWTYFAHRTNTDKWEEDPFNEKVITIKRIMSVVTEHEIYQELMHYGKNHLQGFSVGKGEPFEIRCLICDPQHLRALDDSNELKNVMLKEFYFDRRNFGGCYGQRHHSIPPKEELVVIGISDYDEVFDKPTKIIWTIPRRFIDFYKEEVNNNKNRTIELNTNESNKMEV